MNFFIWRKNIASLSRYLDFGILVKSTNFKICDVICYTYTHFLWIVNTIKMKFFQMLVCCMTNISNMFLAQCWRLGTFMILLKLNYSEIWPFLIWPLFTFSKKKKHWNLDVIGYCEIGPGCEIKKDLERSSSPPNCSKIPENYSPCL